MNEHPEITYLPRQCQLLKKEVWAIRARQPDGSWKIVNCLDKDRRCFHYKCALTTDQGEWPFEDIWIEELSRS